MIHLQPNTPNQSIYTTFYERRKDFDVFTHYLVRFVNMVSRREYSFIANTSVDVERYTKVSISTDSDNAVNGDIVLTETGMFHYYVYGQNSETNLNHRDTSVVGMIESGAMYVDETFTDTEYFTNDEDSYMYDAKTFDVGFIDYNDTTGEITLNEEEWTTIPNNGLGAFSNSAYAPTNITSVMDTDTGALDFSQLSLGSEVFIRNDFTVTPNTNNSLLEVRYLLGTGDGQYALKFWSERLDSGSGIEYQRVISFPIYMGDLNTRHNAGILQVRLSSAGAITNSGSYISIKVRR